MWRIWVASFLMRIQSLWIWIGTEEVMLALGRGCKSRLSLAERIDQLLAGSFQKLNSEGQVTMVSLFHCILQWNNDRNKVLNKCNELESSRNHTPISYLWKNCLPWKGFLVAKRLGMADLLGILFWGLLSASDSNFQLKIWILLSNICSFSCPLLVKEVIIYPL